MSESTLIPVVIVFGLMLAISLIGFVKSFATAVRMDATSQHMPPHKDKHDAQARLGASRY